MRASATFEKPGGNGAWEAIAESAGGKAVDPPAEVLSAEVAQLDLTPEYVPRKEDGLEPEGNTALTRVLDAALAEDESEGRSKLFGTDRPFTTDWTSFIARDLATGEALEVVESAGALTEAVAYELLPSDLTGRRAVRLYFPQGSEGRVIEVTAVGTVTDPFGASSEARTTTWSHVIQGSPGPELADAVLRSAAAMRDLDSGALFAQSEVVLDPDATAAEDNPSARAARLEALRAAEDGQVTVAELRQVLAAVDAWTAKP